MKLITIDFETFYSADYSLSKLTTEAYIRDSRFQVIGFSYKVDDEYPVWVTGPMPALARALRELKIDECALLAHNMAFDGAILSWIFGVRPKYYFDTLSMARPMHGLTVGVSLAALATTYEVGAKGTEAAQAKGLRREDFGPEQLAEYGTYCSNDVQLTYDIFQTMRPAFPKRELYVIDLLMRMYCDPVLELDRDVLDAHLKAVRARKESLLASISAVDDAKSVIMSNPKFAELLRGFGVEPPTKISLTTGKDTYAFAKTDEGMRELLEHPDERVQAVVAARLGTKSTIEETRTESFLGIADRGPLPVPLSYYGAHCVTGDVEVLTRRGWERLDTWSGEEIAQVRADQSIEFLPAKRFVGPLDAQWLRVNAPYLQADFTLGHTMPYLTHGSNRWAVEKAEVFANRASRVVPISGRLASVGAITEAQMRVLVMVQADGSYEEDTDVGRGLRVFVKKPRKIERARELLSAAGVTFSEQEYPSWPGYVRFVIRARDYPRWLGLERKIFGPWLLDSTPQAREAFVEELAHWDGWVQGGQTYYCSTEPQNVEWATTVCHLSGRSAVARVKAGRGNRRPLHYIAIRARGHCKVSSVNMAAVYDAQPTFCTVTETGFWLARRNGRIFITGNTGRASGWDKINLQNLPRGGELRRAIRAPDGHTLVAVDSSQIEARVTAWLAGQADLVTDFAAGVDIYSKFATTVYGREITKADKVERFVGKTCLAEGTEVLCETGWKRIEGVTVDDRVWDGEEWVCHQGLIFNGWKQTLPLCGLWLTPDHLVWSGTNWLDAQSLAQDGDTLFGALATAAENLPSVATFSDFARALPRSLFGAIAAGPSTPSTETTSRTSEAHDAMCVPAKRLVQSDIGLTPKRCLTTLIERAYSTGSRRLSLAALRLLIARTSTTVGVVYEWIQRGWLTALRSFDTYRPSPAGTTPHWISTASTPTVTTSRGTCASSADQKTPATAAASQTLRQKLPVYDLACAGPRNRFTVRTDAGPLIVHNCVLGLGFGMGPQRLRDSLKNGAISVEMDLNETKRLVQIYRRTYGSIAALWEEASEYLDHAARGFEYEFGSGLRLKGDPDGIHLPNGMMVRYPGLRREGGEYFYSARKRPTRLHGPKVIENVVQALARIVVFDQMARIDQALRALDRPDELQRYRVVCTVHDEVIACVPEDFAATCLPRMVQAMSVAPNWASGLPIACEGAVGSDYAECK